MNWTNIAERYLEIFFGITDSKGMNLKLVISSDDAVTYLANHFRRADEYRESLLGFECNDCDTFSTEEQREQWFSEKWEGIFEAMQETSYFITNEIHRNSTGNHSNRFYRLAGTVDLKAIRGILYKNLDEKDDSESSIAESDYETD